MSAWITGPAAVQEVSQAELDAAAAAAVAKALVDAKGDLLVASDADVIGRLAVGTDGHVLTADSAQTLGVKWAEAEGGGGASATVNVVAASGAAETLTNDVDYYQDITMDVSCTFTFAAMAAGDSFVLILRQGAGGSKLATWPAAVDWQAATPPLLSTAAGDVDVFSFFTTDGSVIFGCPAGFDFS